MELMNWIDQYSVGVKKIDEQHKTLVGMLNKLYDAMMNHCAIEITEPLVKQLVQYTQTHFADEEALMATTGFPQLNEHREQHRRLIERVQSHVSHAANKDLFQPVQLLHFLKEWLTVHIQQEDKLYGPWLQSHGQR
jgi:hemerythrin